MTALDARTAADVLRELSRTAAAGAEVPGLDPATTWAALLFAAGALRDPAEPSQALLATAADLYEGLAEHFSSVPERARRHWLEETLGIARLPMVPDEVVAVATGDPKVLPVVLPSGAELRGGKAPSGAERTYETTDVLTVLGAELAGVHGYRVDVTTDRAATWADPVVPFPPFDGSPAVHHLDIVTDAIRFEGGDADVIVSFAGADARVFDEGAQWQYSTPDGLADAVSAYYAATGATVRLSGRCGPCDLDGVPATFLRVSFPGDAAPPGAFALATGAVTVKVDRKNLRPEGGFYNDGKLDVTKEFQPFGPVPRRGDSFYLRSDETFGKALEKLTVTIELLDNATGSAYFVDYAAPYQSWVGAEITASMPTFFETFEYDSRAPDLKWQRYAEDGTWTWYDSAGSTLHGATVSTGLPVGVLSQETEVAGQRGRFVRLFLADGDFGWEDYLSRIADFAAAAAGPGDPVASDLVPPTPPTVSDVTIEYVTRAVEVTDLRTRNGQARAKLPGGSGRRPFARPVEVTAGAAGTVSFGFAVEARHLGSALSWYADVAQAPACASAGRVFDAWWEYWSTSGGWLRVDLLDGTRGLRQSGLVRLVTPRDWADGCDDVSADTGRWLRLRTTTPDFVGDLLAVHVDAVTARYRSEAPDPATDLAPLTPLLPKQLKGLRKPIPGVKVTNPVPGTPGRAAEQDGEYPARASAVVRHRNRGVQAWDYESLVTTQFPEVAAVRCLPHADADGCAVPGSVGLVVVPRSTELQPYPSVTLADRIASTLRPQLPVHARVTVLCPEYVPVRVRAVAVLARGVAAADARDRLTAAIDGYLHPLSAQRGGGAPFGRALYPSSLVAFLESLADVDHVEEFALLLPVGEPARVDVDPCRGLIASAGDHVLALSESL